MPVMKCAECGADYPYRNKRGFKAPKQCRCGGELKKAGWDYQGAGGYKIIENKIKKGKMVSCAICGRRRKSTGYNAVQLKEEKTFKVIRGGWLTGKEDNLTVPAGAFICWSHSEKHATHLTA